MTSRSIRSRPIAALLGALALAFVVGCTETNTEYVERPQFNPPPDSVNGFMGYYTVSTKQTTCGNCHVGFQGEWIDTRHANAYGTPETSGHAAPYCYSCHTVSQNGNVAGAAGQPAGYDLVPDPAYHDVQCESCHGPGYDHVSNPNDDNHPLARAGLNDTITSCGGCHSGTHHPFVEQWSQTGHADSIANASQALNPSCMGCHEGRTALARFNGGKKSTYIELDSVGEMTTLPPATCAVCHDPHGSPYGAQLRLPVDSPDPNQNLCMSCHNRGTAPSSNFSNSTATVTRRGAHASQGPILLGEGAGYIPTGFVFDPENPANTTHNSDKNARLCAGCHVNSFEVTDAETGAFLLTSVGHLFSPDPCLDANGVPVADNSCAYTATARNWSACTNAGCHANAGAASAALNSRRALTANLADQLWKDVNPTLNSGGEPYMDALDTGYLPKLLFGLGVNNNPMGTDGFLAFDPNDAHVSPAEGALFNAMMLAEDLYGHRDGSYGAHNPFYYNALLAASIEEVLNTYPSYLPAPPPAVQAAIDQALNRPGIRYAPAQAKLSAAR